MKKSNNIEEQASNRKEEDVEKCHNTVNNNQGDSQKEDDVLQIVINKNMQLYDTLKSPKRVLNAGCLLTIFLMVLFIGFTTISLVIKERIPYQTVMANDYGAFEMRNEKSDVFYFLFNTAELWCNSGIEVSKGQRVTIKASGIFNTEISHMHDKEKPIYWIRADGRAAEKGPNHERDEILKKNGVFIDAADPCCLLVAVIDDESLIDNWQNYKIGYDSLMKNIKVKPVGMGTEYLIPNDGVLLFTVNDVVFNQEHIDIVKKLHNDKRHPNDGIDTLYEKIITIESIIKKSNKSLEEKERDRNIQLERMWYNDNLGSFLIVVERPRFQEKEN